MMNDSGLKKSKKTTKTKSQFSSLTPTLSHAKWKEVRRELYRQIKSQVQIRLGLPEKELLKYENEFEKEIKSKISRWKPILNSEIFFRTLAQSRIILMGDFHASQQSQKSHLRVLRELQKRQIPIVLGLECFETKHQELINQYLVDEISEKTLLKETGWKQRWGFPWEHYEPIFKFAKNHFIPIYGLNLKHNDKSVSLKKRDEFAALQINKILKKYKKNKVSVKNSVEPILFVIYGDLHLAKNHLPREISKKFPAKIKSSLSRIFQNQEDIYFELLSQGLENKVDIVSFSKNDFCILNVPPWVKWQNYLMYLENSYDIEMFADEDIAYEDHVSTFVNLIEKQLFLKVKQNEISIYTAQDPSFWNLLNQKCKPEALKSYEWMIEASISFYIPELKAGYLARTNVNHLAKLAMQFILAQHLNVKKSYFKMPQHFTRMIWWETLSYFGNKLVNPKRKSDTLSDLRSTLLSRGPNDAGYESLKLALAQKMLELKKHLKIKNKKTSFKLGFTPKNKGSYLEAARLIGAIQGEKIYNGYVQELLSMEQMSEWLTHSFEDKNFEDFYESAVEMIDRFPSNFKSKKERM